MVTTITCQKVSSTRRRRNNSKDTAQCIKAVSTNTNNKILSLFVTFQYDSLGYLFLFLIFVTLIHVSNHSNNEQKASCSEVCQLYKIYHRLRAIRALTLFNVPLVTWGHYRHRLCTVIVPFWFSMEHLWTALMPFWLSTDNVTLFMLSQWIGPLTHSETLCRPCIINLLSTSCICKL